MAKRTSILSRNLLEMDGSMMRLLRTESIGGNAGRVKIGGRYFGCAAANGYADPRSGQIVQFGNMQDVPSAIRDANAAFTFRVACSARTFFRIVQVLTDNRGGAPRLTAPARAVLDASVARWNESRE